LGQADRRPGIAAQPEDGGAQLNAAGRRADPNETWTIRASEHHSRIDCSLFEGGSLAGRVKKVFLRGELIVDGPHWKGREGMGGFIKRGEAGHRTS
jgi:hypothetical protein